MYFSVTFHHRGEFVNAPARRYEAGEIHTMHGIDEDKWSYFEAVGILRDEFGHNGNYRLWWKKSEDGWEDGLKEVMDDRHALEMANYALSRDGVKEVDLFVEHLDPSAYIGIQRPTEINMDSMMDGVAVGDDSSDEELNDVHLNDSEEERARDIDDGFDVQVNAIDREPTPAGPKKHLGRRKSRAPKRPWNVGEKSGSSSKKECVGESDFVPVPMNMPKRRKERAGINIEDILGEGVQGESEGVQGEGVGVQGEGVQPPRYAYFVQPPHDADNIEEGYETEELISGESDLEDDRPKSVRFKPEHMSKDYKFELGMQFGSLAEFKKAILEHSVLNGREIVYVKNDKGRVRMKCKHECGWKILVSRVGDSHTYMLKTYNSKHTCGRVFNNTNATPDWVTKVVTEKMKTTSGDVTLNDILADIRTKYSTGITMYRAWKAKCMAKEIVDGDAKKQYSQLWSYAAELRNANRGNICRLDLVHPAGLLQPRFGRWYMCLEGCKSAFKAACRPLIGVDGCHLKNNYGGQLLIAVGRDPNDQYLPIAFAVVETETKDSWGWFLNLLFEDIGDLASNRWVFISDQQKGLIPTFDEYPEGVEHRFCLRHLYNNFKKKFGGGTLLRDLMMAAAKATYIQAWEEKMQELKGLNEQAYDWLMAIPTKSWCKHAFSHYPRCDILMNNLSEAFNSTILVARDKPIITMCEWIRTYLMQRFANLRDKVSKYEGEVMPKPRKRLDWEIEKSGSWLPTWEGGDKFEVTHRLFIEKFKVDLGQKSCTCNFWGLVGIPCRHAVAAISFMRQNPESYIHRYYSRESYALCYGHGISSINGPKMWPKTNYNEVFPPKYKKGPGRPKKLRRREPDEDANKMKFRRVTNPYTCKRCGQSGHNIRKCPMPAPPPPEPIPVPQPAAAQATSQAPAPPPAASQAPAPPKRGGRKGSSSRAATAESGGRGAIRGGRAHGRGGRAATTGTLPAEGGPENPQDRTRVQGNSASQPLPTTSAPTTTASVVPRFSDLLTSFMIDKGVIAGLIEGSEAKNVAASGSGSTQPEAPNDHIPSQLSET